jgi:hypothetical protein
MKQPALIRKISMLEKVLDITLTKERLESVQLRSEILKLPGYSHKFLKDLRTYYL